MITAFALPMQDSLIRVPLPSQISVLWDRTDSQHTWRLVLSEVNVGQNKVDDNWTVVLHVRILGFKDIALLQSLSIKHVRVDLGEGQLVHFSPLLCQ